VWQTSLPCLDAAGFYPGAITEVVGEAKSCGAGLLIAALVENPGVIQQPVVLVDGCDAFDPHAVTAAARNRLLWLRCKGLTNATQAADLLLRDGNMPLILLDLQLCASRQLLSLPSSIWHRLRFLAEKSGAVLCVFTPCRVIACARSRLILEQAFSLKALEQPRAELVRDLQTRVERSARGGVTAPQVALAN
ncbi:MAG TPA: hypothetical protein VD994_10500, partial [Prosthecobacter sp.]|nr:hypothetical protein [Prosthecobacter sp.]